MVANIQSSASTVISAEVYDQSFKVQFRYPVVFTADVFNPVNHTLRNIIAGKQKNKCHNLIVFVDDGVYINWPGFYLELNEYIQAHNDVMCMIADPVSIPGGESCKNDLTLLDDVYSVLNECNVDRQSFVLLIGGGAVLDLVGYAAATTHRGGYVVRLPTTVLAQNISGVSVTYSLNCFHKKSFVGAFAPPYAVINDRHFLEMLNPRDRRAGIAEAIKVALIRDRNFFQWIEANIEALFQFDPEVECNMIRRCAELHMMQIIRAEYPFETGKVRPLEYGHWSACKLEMMTNHALRHGEAVAIGIALDARYSVISGLLAVGEDIRICNVIERLGLPVWHPAITRRNDDGELLLLEGLQEYREHPGGDFTVTLLADIGSSVEVHTMNNTLIAEAIAWLMKRSSNECDSNTVGSDKR